ncbi:Pol I core factor CF [Phlyctochytrium planicorne]|nr:Pol I core factor CF [Phlyctochytrium planicorne]
MATELREEVSETDFRGTARRSKRARRAGKKKTLVIKDPTEDTVDMIYEIFQYALLVQVEALIRTRSFPTELKESVMYLWLLYSNKTQLRRKKSKGTTNRNISLNPDMLQPRVIESMHTFKNSYFLVLIYLACRELQLPVFSGDILRMAARGDIPYMSCYSHLPPLLEKKMKLNTLYFVLVKKPILPTWSEFMKAVSTFVTFFNFEYELNFPPLNTPLLIFELVKRLDLPADFYVFAVAIQDIRKWGLEKRTRVEEMEVRLASNLAVALKIFTNAETFFTQGLLKNEVANRYPVIRNLFKAHFARTYSSNPDITKHLRADVISDV